MPACDPPPCLQWYLWITSTRLPRTQVTQKTSGLTHHLCFTVGETEAQKSKVTAPVLFKGWMAEPGLGSRMFCHVMMMVSPTKGSKRERRNLSLWCSNLPASTLFLYYLSVTQCPHPNLLLTNILPPPLTWHTLVFPPWNIPSSKPLWSLTPS